MEAEAAIATLAGVLTLSAVTGVLHGKGVNQIGDRVACGMFALPLIWLLAKDADFALAPWLAPAPLAIYLVVLALADLPSDKGKSEKDKAEEEKRKREEREKHREGDKGGSEG